MTLGEGGPVGGDGEEPGRPTIRAGLLVDPAVGIVGGLDRDGVLGIGAVRHPVLGIVGVPGDPAQGFRRAGEPVLGIVGVRHEAAEGVADDFEVADIGGRSGVIGHAAPHDNHQQHWEYSEATSRMIFAYDSSGNLLEQAVVQLPPPGSVGAAWIGFRRTQPEIATIIVQPDQSHIGGDDYVNDNIHYKPSGPGVPVPEPSTLLLLGSGLAGLGGVAWRRHRRG